MRAQTRGKRMLGRQKATAASVEDANGATDLQAGQTRDSDVPCGKNGKPLRGRALKRYERAAENQERANLRAGLRQAKRERRQIQAEAKSMGIEARLKAQDRDAKKRSAANKDRLKRARTVQGSIGFEKMHEDGLCMVREGLYSRTVSFDDIGYRTSRIDEQKRIFNAYCDLLNYLDASMHLQLNIVNKPITQEEFNRKVFLEPLGDQNDRLVEEYNAMLATHSSEQGQTIEQYRYLTVSVEAPTREKAQVLLGTALNDIQEQLRAIGSDSHRLDGRERLALLASQLLPKEEYAYDYESGWYENLSPKDSISPMGFDFKPNGANTYFKFGEKHGEVLYMKELPADLGDDFISDLLDLPLPINVTMHYTAFDHAKAVTEVRKKLAFMDQQRASEAKQAAKQGLDSSFVSDELKHQKEQGADLLNQLRNQNQRLLFVSGLIYVWGETYEELDSAVFQLCAEARKSGVKLASLDMRQKLGLNATLPIGCDYSDVLRTMTTAEASIFMPFLSAELAMQGGTYGGINNVSGKMIIYNRKMLKAPMGWILGKPGGGKSFSVKREAFNNFITNPYDEFIFVDPKGEYGLFVEAVGGEVYKIAPDSTTWINPFDISTLYAGEGGNPVAFKSSFILTMIDSVLGGPNGVGAVEHTIIDRVVKLLYRDMRDDWAPEEMPTMVEFYELLKAQKDPEALRLARGLELYTTGTLSCFTHRTNTTVHKRIRTYDTSALPVALRPLAMLIVLDQVNNRAAYNYARGVRTWLYIDEAQNYFEQPTSIEYFDKTFSEGRSKLIIPTAITQNVDRVICHDRARQMLSNSDFLLLLSQAANDLKYLAPTINMSPREVDCLTNAKPGSGLMIHGAARIPFKDEFPKNTELYRLFSTDPNEREEEARRKRQAEKIARANAARDQEKHNGR